MRKAHWQYLGLALLAAVTVAVVAAATSGPDASVDFSGLWDWVLSLGG